MIGLLYPTRDCGEDDFLACARKLDPDLTVDFAYVPWGANIGRVDDLDPVEKHEAVRELGAPERLAAAARFGTTPDVVSWACSSCSFTRGLAGARDQASVLSERLGVPARSTSLAYLTALAHLGTKRVALASVYHHDTTATFVDFLAEAGIDTALHTTPLLEDLETALGKPVLTATAVTLWDALHALGAPPVRRGLGKLFSR
ncbi:decarboxylase [Amycolatopsis sp. CB00013]|uniref:aspartate racemase/maleate isomerase family protein n=1 Tax=Amycolatopsis sp. CB00013 TaxID=1703945 RepID=UPI000962CA2D|nr:decarboxylase [Amycolatopsis sp. CB00013]OKJ91921.1 decarboxylase [Amycolatopsis sp. CB00013]